MYIYIYIRIRREYETKQLVFSPNNAIFRNLTAQVSKQLEFTQEPIGVNDDDELQRAMTNKQMLAGINFHHPHVNMNNMLH